MENRSPLESLKERYPEKFVTPENAFSRIRRGNELFIGSACGEPAYLVETLCEYAAANPKAFFDVEIIHYRNMGPAQYTDPALSRNFRLNSFFVCENAGRAVSSGLADYTPVFPFQIPGAFSRGFIDLDAALIQVSPPDADGSMSLGVSVDIVRAAVKRAELVIAQVNRYMPRTSGDTLIGPEEIDFIIPFDEPLIEYRPESGGDSLAKIGRYVSLLVRDGDTIQTGSGSLPGAVLAALSDKKDLGIHTEILTDGMIDLMRRGVVTNKKKSRDTGVTVASLCAGSKSSFDYIDGNPHVHLMPVDYTNCPRVIASQTNMLSINEPFIIDLTGQTTEEDPETGTPRGIGGRADFIRGTAMAPGGTGIFVLQSTTPDGGRSRIVSSLGQGSGLSSLRCDAEYVVTEHGYAFLRGKSLRERAMAMISIAHPEFRASLLEEAKSLGLVNQSQGIVAGAGGEYPEYLVTEKLLKGGDAVLMRPCRISDEDIIREFFYSLSDNSIKRRFMNSRLDMPHDRLRNFVVINYKKEMVLLAVQQKEDEVETVIGMCEYRVHPDSNYGEAAFAVRDDHQGMGLGYLLLNSITNAAMKEGLNGFTAEVLVENTPMMRLFERADFEIHKSLSDGVYELKMSFKRQ